MSNTKSYKKTPYHHTDCDRLFRYAEFLGYGDLHVKFDHATGLRAIVAIHNLKRGPAIGGARLIHYKNTDEALEDALRLAHMMSLKAAISHLPHGGAKAVLIKPKVIKDRKAYFEAFGDFVNELGGRYITATDSGTSMDDMDVVATRTPYVTCTHVCGDSSIPTALGVLYGIEAAVKFKFGKNDLAGTHVVVQGLGHVGIRLIELLHERGAKLTASDVNADLAQDCAKKWGVTIVPADKIFDVQADVFAPCALGSVLNLNTIKRLRVSIIAGSANNQLAHHHYGIVLHEQDILYVPDFVINSGGLIHAAAMYDYSDQQRAIKQVSGIGDSLMAIFERSKKENLSTNEIAEKMAVELLR